MVTPRRTVDEIVEEVNENIKEQVKKILKKDIEDCMEYVYIRIKDRSYSPSILIQILKDYFVNPLREKGYKIFEAEREYDAQLLNLSVCFKTPAGTQLVEAEIIVQEMDDHFDVSANILRLLPIREGGIDPFSFGTTIYYPELITQ